MTPTYGTRRSRKERRQKEATVRNALYALMPLDQKIEGQLRYTVASQNIGKQLRKLTAIKEKQG